MSVLAFVASCAQRIKKFPSNLTDLYKDHQLRSSILSALETSKSIRSPSKDVLSQTTSRPFAPLPRYESNHVRQTTTDLVTAAPVALLSALPIVGYGAMVGAFVVPRYTLSRQFHDDDERWQFASEDVLERAKFYPTLSEIVNKHVKIEDVAKALNLYRTLEPEHMKVDDQLKYIQEVLSPFRAGGPLCFSINGLARNDLIFLAASRGLTRLHVKEFGGVLNVLPSNVLRRILKKHAVEVKTDDYLIHAEKLTDTTNEVAAGHNRTTNPALSAGEVRDASVLRGLAIRKNDVDAMVKLLRSHVSIVGREIGFLDDSKASVTAIPPSLVLFLPALIQDWG